MHTEITYQSSYGDTEICPSLFIFFLYLASGVGLESQPDVEELPAAVPQGCFKPVFLQPDQRPIFVMFDLETTDLSKYM